jgi:hypothetical protein
MRFNEFEQDAKRNIAEHKASVDEAMPVIGSVASAAGRVGTAMGSKVAKAGADVAKQVGAKAVGGAVGAGKKMAQQVGQKATDMMANKLLKRGQKLPMQSTAGKPEEFEIDAVSGDTVTLKNPKPTPGEPIKTVHSKKDLEPTLKQMAGQ